MAKSISQLIKEVQNLSNTTTIPISNFRGVGKTQTMSDYYAMMDQQWVINYMKLCKNYDRMPGFTKLFCELYGIDKFKVKAFIYKKTTLHDIFESEFKDIGAPSKIRLLTNVINIYKHLMSKRLHIVDKKQLLTKKIKG